MQEQLFLADLILKPASSIENFVVGENAELIFILSHLKAGEAIFLWGGAGTGKTHLLQAMADSPEHFYTPTSFPSDSSELPQFTANSIVCVDDVQHFSASQQDVLFNLYNEWQARKVTDTAFSIISAADKPPMQLTMREDLRNRLGWGLVYEVHMLNDDDCKNALEQRAAAKGLRLNRDVIQWIFSHCPRDARTLFALLEALDAYSLKQQRPITIPLLKNLIQSQEFFQ
ncbi:DnaA regulatory inactivator Hda [Pelistega europaea]|uniref:DnaA regulatory inactivator Hda n=1 Tax=Pelistega europaea TaxID=106147 RepID=A0A7Y4P4N5_9BURK|nr:DnaA regulatory inactivator Hda [Pelistega europaea]NOL50262.1 DnaA regulatory inactivator Hda [Pelistega europaea]